MGSRQQVKPAPIFQSFLMNVAEDGKEQNDWFELGEISCEFARPKPTCPLRVASFIASDVTRVNLWSHTAHRVTEIRPNVFKVEMNGRLNPSAGLEIIVEFDSGRTRIVEITGSMRSGSRNQSTVTFRVDRRRESRSLPPLRNPSGRLKAGSCARTEPV